MGAEGSTLVHPQGHRSQLQGNEGEDSGIPRPRLQHSASWDLSQGKKKQKNRFYIFMPILI